jgi:hypothetical protein
MPSAEAHQYARAMHPVVNKRVYCYQTNACREPAFSFGIACKQ